MVKAVGFAVRSAAGAVVQGAVTGDPGSQIVRVGAGEAVSLNLAPGQVAGYARQGGNLIVTLADGREIVVAGYFEAPAGLENKLFLSSDSNIAEVSLTGNGGAGLTPSYGANQPWGGYSALEDLRFGPGGALAVSAAPAAETTGMAPFVPGLLAGFGGNGLLAAGAVAGGAALIGGGGGGGESGGGGGGSGGRAKATVARADATISLSANTTDPQISVTGTGEPGDAVQVKIGSLTLNTTITSKGIWSVRVPEADLPADGTYEAVVTVTPPAGSGVDPVTLDGPAYVIDMTPPPVAVTEGSRGAGHIENAADLAGGVTLGGTGEPGAAIRVDVAGVAQTATVNAQGTWSVTFPASQIVAGDYSVPVTVTATDIHGNRTVINETLVVDTVANTVALNPVTPDNLVDRAEQAAGFAVTGTTAAGASVTVVIGGLTQTVTAGTDGKWAVNIAPGALAQGDYEATVTATTKDAAGNTSSATQTIQVDTIAGVSLNGPIAGDDLVNAAESALGVALSGTVQAGSVVNVAWNGTTLPATVSANGTWVVTFPGSTLPTGEQMTSVTVTAIDPAGNTATTARPVRVDTTTSASVNPLQAGGDNLISGAEHQAGIALNGRAEPGASVAVTLQGVTRTVTAGADGSWTATFARSEIPEGSYTTSVQVRATDLAGNRATASHLLTVDTEVGGFAKTSDSLGSDRVLNGAEAAQGLSLAGTVEPGSSLSIRLGTGQTRAALVGADGSWSLTIPASDVPPGTGTVPLTLTATDRTGNVATQTEQVRVDTLVTGFARTGGTIGGDGMLNANDVALGLPLGGTVEAGAMVVVRLSSGVEKSVIAGADGQWAMTFSQAELPQGEQTVTVRMTATDAAGNTAVLTDSFRVDTLGPGTPEILGYSSNSSGLRRISTDIDAPDLTFASVDATGKLADVPARRVDNAFDQESEYRFDDPLPDGSYLVVNAGDAAGNQSSTLFIVNNSGSSTVNLGRSGLSQFDFSAIDLTFAPDARMTITESQLQALTGPDHKLTVKGGVDDTVTLTGALVTGQTTVIDGERYAIFTLGTGGTVLVDDDINAII